MNRYELLNTTRLGMLISQKSNREPIGVPIWFDWDGEKLRFFAAAESKKVRRLERNRHISLVVTNNVGEPEAWIAFDGDVTLCEAGGIDLAEILAQRYWDMSATENQTKLEAWKSFPDAFLKYEMIPSNLRQGS